MDYQRLLKDAGLRLTKQRLALGELLFGGGDRHVTAEIFYDEARAKGIDVSLATIYNTLHQFQEAGLVEQVVVDGSRTYFDTNTSSHHHFYFEDSGELVDIPGADIRMGGMPSPPSGTSVSRVDVIVRVKNS